MITKNTPFILAALLAVASSAPAGQRGFAPAAPGAIRAPIGSGMNAVPGSSAAPRLAPPLAISAVGLPSAIPAAQIVPVAAPTGAQRLEQGLNRVSEAMANLDQSGKASDGQASGGARQVQAAMTGEKLAAAAGDVQAAPEDSQRQQSVDNAKATLENILDEVGKVIVGQREMTRAILIALVAREHVLLEGYPGVGKTKTAKAFAAAVEGKFERIQGTPDKLPSDITGTEVLQDDPENPGQKKFVLLKGPIFTNILLADEVNRMTPKTQSALLEGMGEGQVTVARETIALERFTVLATQNPVEQEGTYPLPEAQLDRFMFKIVVPQPSSDDMLLIGDRNDAKDVGPQASKVTTLAGLDEIRLLAESVRLDDQVALYINRVAMAATEDEELKKNVEYSVYPRSIIFLRRAARIHALMQGRDYVVPDDVRALAKLVMRHRIKMNYQSNVDVEKFIDMILERVK